MPRIKVSDYIAEYLVSHGVKQGFTVTGGGAMHLNDSFGHTPGLSMLYNHHEQASAIAAESYARVNNEPALLCVTTGPGGINALNGVCGAYLDSFPMIVISGQVRYDTTVAGSGLKLRAMGDQEFEICKAVECMTKYCEMVVDPKRIRYCLEKALFLTKNGRPGPVWLDIPLNVQGAYLDSEEIERYEHYQPECGTDYPAEDELSPELLGEIVKRINEARRPVIYAGNGIRISGAYPVFEKLVQMMKIPVVTGWDSIDLMSDDDIYYVGRGGIMGDRAGNFAVQNSDLVLSIGSRLSIRQVGYNHESWAREAFVIMNDIDREELKKPTIHVNIPVCADAGRFMTVLYELAEAGKIVTEGVREEWVLQCNRWKMKYPVVQEKHYAQEIANVYAFVKELSRRLPEGKLTVVGNGSACVVGSAAYVIKKGQRFLINSALASMGYDLPAAIGACVANGFEDIICITGDGSLQMNIQELQTIIHHRMPIKLFVINNAGYHSIRQTQTNFFKRTAGIGPESGDISFPSLEKLSAAYGFDYVKIEKTGEMQAVLDDVLNRQGPVICEIFVSVDQKFEPKSATKKLEDGTLVSAPLEDLAPFLDPEELKSNMYIPLMEEEGK